MQYKQLVLALKDEWVPIETYRVEGLSTVWLSSKFDGDEASFAQQFSFADPNTTCLEELCFNQEEKLLVLGERYGGKGIGYNGGGARCGTIGPYQLKGIGANQLVGDHNNQVHSYGGLDARSAICEAIFTNVLSKVLPVGVADVYGIIFTGKNAAIDPMSQEKCWGSILVREACVRPAHFLPATGFQPRVEHGKSLRPDFARTKIVNQKLDGNFSSPNEYVMFLGEFLSRCANQMAFARVARVMHSTMTPSNISIDGRWLDLPLSSFISGGENFGLSSIFYQEVSEPLGFCMELIHTYGKMNNIVLNPAPLIAYYNEQVDAYCSHHLGYLFGLPFEKLNNQFKPDLDTIKILAMSIINKGKDINRRWAEPDPNDPVTDLVVGAFISLEDSRVGRGLLEKCGLSPIQAEQFSAAFRRLTQALAMMYGCSARPFTMKYALIALKRAILSGIFYLSLVDKAVKSLCSNGDPAEISHLINSYDETANWIFENSTDDNLTIYKTENFVLKSGSRLNTYSVYDGSSNNVQDFPSLTEALSYFGEIVNFKRECFRGFSYEDYFNRLSQLNQYLCPHKKNRGAHYAA